MIDGKNFFDQPIETYQREDYTTGCLLDYIFF